MFVHNYYFQWITLYEQLTLTSFFAGNFNHNGIYNCIYSIYYIMMFSTLSAFRMRLWSNTLKPPTAISILFDLNFIAQNVL